MFCGWAFQAAEIRCQKNETNIYWNGLNKLLMDEFTDETVFHEDCSNEGRFSAFRGWSADHRSNFRVGGEIQNTLDTIFQLNFTDDFLEFFFNSKHLTHLSVFMFDYVQK